MLYIINAAYVYVNVLKCSVNRGTYFPNYNHFPAFSINQNYIYYKIWKPRLYVLFQDQKQCTFFIDPGYHKDYFQSETEIPQSSFF